MLGRTTRRTLAATVAGIAACLIGAAGADAAAPWLPSVNVSAPSANYISAQAVALARDGTAYVLWTQTDGANNRAYLASRPPGGSFTRLASPLSPAGQDADSPHLAVDRQGNATAVWRRCDPSACVIQAAVKRVGGGWQAAVDLSDTSTSADSPDLAVGDNTAAIVVWKRLDSGIPRTEAALRPAGSSFFGSRSYVSPAAGTSMCGPRAAMDAAGDAVVLWQRLDDPDGAGAGVPTWIMETNERTAGSSFSLGGVQSRSSTTQSTSNAIYIGAYSCTYDVAMTPAGRTLAIWDYSNGGTTPGSIFVEYADRVLGSSFATGSWSSKARGSLSNQNAEVPFVALDDAGNAVATWSAYDGSNWGVQSSTRQGLGAWGARTDLSGPGGGAFQSTIAASPGGDGVIVWPGNSGANSAIFGARRRPGTDFGGIGAAATGTSTTSYGGPAVALDAQGNGFAVFTRTVNTGSFVYTLQAAGIDPVAPTLSLSVPGGGNVGQAVGMSAQAGDRMSGAGVTWSFGDGGSAGGSSVSHAYGAPGAYTVTATARDGAGNQASQSRTISIVSGGGGGIDADGDGFFAGQDCNDHNPQINPSAKEIPGNNVDENCDGIAAPFPDIKATSTPLWSISGSRFTLVSLQIKGARRGMKITLGCAGRGCPFRSKTLKSAKQRKANFEAIKKLGGKRRFLAGETLTVKFTAPRLNTKFSVFKLKAGKIPNGRARCRTLGTTRLRACR